MILKAAGTLTQRHASPAQSPHSGSRPLRHPGYRNFEEPVKGDRRFVPGRADGFTDISNMRPDLRLCPLRPDFSGYSRANASQMVLSTVQEVGGSIPPSAPTQGRRRAFHGCGVIRS